MNGNRAEFLARLETGQTHELRVLESLIRRGWHAEWFGQAMLSETMRTYLRTVDTFVRWMPDIIAAKNIAGRNQIVFVDAKGGQRYKETGNHDVETSSVKAAAHWITLNRDRCPTFLVFGDGGVATPADVEEHGRPGTFRGTGSGTPFMLIPAAKTRPFESVFGQPICDLAERAKAWAG
jgi:hypothetical protein